MYFCSLQGLWIASVCLQFQRSGLKSEVFSHMSRHIILTPTGSSDWSSHSTLMPIITLGITGKYDLSQAHIFTIKLLCLKSRATKTEAELLLTFFVNIKIIQFVYLVSLIIWQMAYRTQTSSHCRNTIKYALKIISFLYKTTELTFCASHFLKFCMMATTLGTRSSACTVCSYAIKPCMIPAVSHAGVSLLL